jgi:hypothetical protein
MKARSSSTIGRLCSWRRANLPAAVSPASVLWRSIANRRAMMRSPSRAILSPPRAASASRRLYREWQSSFDDPPLDPERHDVPLLDEDPHAEEAFQRAMAQAAALADPSITLQSAKPRRKPKEPR